MGRPRNSKNKLRVPDITFPLCICGCRQSVTKLGNRFISGHNSRIKNPIPRGSKRPSRTRKAISRTNKGNQNLGGWLGKHLYPETRHKLSLLHTGKKHTPETIELIRQAKIGRTFSETHRQNLTNANRRRFQNETKEQKEYRISKAIAGLHKKPTKLELKLGNIIFETCPGEWKYVGDGQIIIDGLNPDFFNTNGKKKVIEAFGTYWHRNDNPQDRINRFSKFGYDCLIIWEHDLDNLEKDKLIETIKSFNER